MTYPRLLKEGTAEEQRLLRAAQGDRPSPHTQAQVLARLGMGLSAAATASLATEATSKALTQTTQASLFASLAPGVTTLISWAKWVGIATVALGVGLGTTAAAKHFVRAKDARSFVTSNRGLHPSNHRAVATRAHTNRIETPRTINAPASPEPVAEAAATVPTPRAPIAKTQASSNDNSDVSGLEVRLIDSARSSLNAGHAAACLTKLEERSRRIKSGMLEPEAALLRVQALLALGQRSAAERTAARFLSRQPNGPISERIRYTLLPATDEQ